MCVYDEHPLAGRDIQYRAPDSRSSIMYQLNQHPVDQGVISIDQIGLDFNVVWTYLSSFTSPMGIT